MKLGWKNIDIRFVVETQSDLPLSVMVKQSPNKPPEVINYLRFNLNKSGPIINRLVQHFGPASGGNIIQIQGLGFNPDDVTVLFNDKPVPEKALESVTSTTIKLLVPPGPEKGGVANVVVISGEHKGKERASNVAQYEYFGGQKMIAPVKFEQKNIPIKTKPARIVYCFGYVFLATGYRGFIYQYKPNDDYSEFKFIQQIRTIKD